MISAEKELREELKGILEKEKGFLSLVKHTANIPTVIGALYALLKHPRHFYHSKLAIAWKNEIKSSKYEHGDTLYWTRMDWHEKLSLNRIESYLRKGHTFQEAKEKIEKLKEEIEEELYEVSALIAEEIMDEVMNEYAYKT